MRIEMDGGNRGSARGNSNIGKTGRRLRISSAGLAIVLAATSLALAAKLTSSRALTVSRSGGENIRKTQNGDKIGTLLEGATVEVLEQDGSWIRFRLEGWIWGPSLDGFREEEEEEEEARPFRGRESREARPALQVHLPEVKKLINDDYGVFYGMSIDKDLSQLVVRLRVRNITREALERRQMAVQGKVAGILEDSVEFTSVRIETNRPDGSGQVGLELAVTELDDIDVDGDETLEEWKQHTRLSSDGGKTWSR